jgi:soluble lytic murein transglycosylase-like protein
VAVCTAIVLALAGCGQPPAGTGAWRPAAAPLDESPTGATEGPTEAPTSAPPSRTASPTAKPRPTPTTRRATRPPSQPKPTPTKKPPPQDLPPPPPKPAPSTGANCPTYYATKAPIATVKAALTTAANTAFWDSVPASRLPVELNGVAPKITVPVPLMKAVAWQESGWQSTIVACDGGRGLMQIMPDTAPWMNQRFGTSHAIDSVSGNANLGAQYLEWLILYFGLYYFGTYDLNSVQPLGANGADIRLRDVVIAAYNVGYGNVVNDDDTLGIPNRSYVTNVVALMTNCVCLTY